MAVGAMQAIRQSGLHTGVDLSVTGFDDLPMARVLTPPLTSVRLPVGIIGRRAIEILVLILHGQVTGLVHELVEPELVVRQSSTGLAG
jgi:LacI family repressor for deo operon, udp, cdd, tsx, nupC, and nupG